MSCDQVGTVISCILFCSDTICFASLRLHPILPISRFRFLHSLSTSFISSFLLYSFPSPFFLQALLSSLVFPSILVSISSSFITPHILHVLLASFLNLSLQFFSILFFIPHFLPSTITTVQSAFILRFQEPHI